MSTASTINWVFRETNLNHRLFWTFGKHKKKNKEALYKEWLPKAHKRSRFCYHNETMFYFILFEVPSLCMSVGWLT